MKQISIFTDGACRGNPGPGGWGVVMRYGTHEKTFSGSEKETTNNRMELMAAIMALKLLREPCRIELYTDSQYLQKGITLWLEDWKNRQWKKSDRKPVKNADLWMMLDEVTEKHGITWHWVKAHNGHRENEMADLLANQAIDEMLRTS